MSVQRTIIKYRHIIKQCFRMMELSGATSSIYTFETGSTSAKGILD